MVTYPTFTNESEELAYRLTHSLASPELQATQHPEIFLGDKFTTPVVEYTMHALMGNFANSFVLKRLVNSLALVGNNDFVSAINLFKEQFIRVFPDNPLNSTMARDNLETVAEFISSHFVTRKNLVLEILQKED